MGLGTAATSASGDFATAAQGTKADNALPAANVSTFGATLINGEDAGAVRTTLGLGISTIPSPPTSFSNIDDVRLYLDNLVNALAGSNIFNLSS